MRLECTEPTTGWLVIEQLGPPIDRDERGWCLVNTIATAWRPTQQDAEAECQRRNRLDHRRHFFVLSAADYEAA
jgi:hypothetical protein